MFRAKLLCVEANVTICLEVCVMCVGAVRALFFRWGGMVSIYTEMLSIFPIAESESFLVLI